MAWQYFEWAKDQPITPAPRKLILLLVAEHANINDGYGYPSLSLLAVESGLSERQVHAHLKALATEDGLIRIEKVKSKRGTYEFNRYWFLCTKEDFAPYLAEDKPYLKARSEAAEARAEATQERPAKGDLIPLGAMLSSGSTASSPTEAWRPGQRKRTSVKPEGQPEYNQRVGSIKIERSGSSSLAPRRAVANAPASVTESTSKQRTIYPRGRPAKNPSANQRMLERLGVLVDRLDPDTVTEAIDEFAKRCGRIVEWAQERAIEYGEIQVAVHLLAAEDYDQFQSHVYYWCLKKYVNDGDWPDELIDPLRAVVDAA